MAISTRYPEGFLWGASTAAHQIEGGNINTDWWRNENSPEAAHNPRMIDPSNDAADSYHRYPEDMALLAAAGLTAYRFSVEWARIEPERGLVSRAQLGHYRRMIETARSLGLEPVITLHHFTNPRWFADLGGWRSDESPKLFEQYALTVLSILDGVDLVCTINEPNMMAIFAAENPEQHWIAGGMPPGDTAVTKNLVAAHKLAVGVLRGAGHRAGWTVATQAFEAEPGAEEVTAEYGWSREDAFLDAAQGDDWVGVQAYTRTKMGLGGPVVPPADVELTLTGWEYYPASLGIGLRRAYERCGGIPLYVTENGIATADDSRRIDYTEAALQGLESALSDGIDIRGYFHWSLLDNYEWGSYAPTFGLIGWDPATFEREPKPSLAWLGSLARRGGLPETATASARA